MTVRLINNAGMELECPVGFSWTTLLFGFFVPLLRGDLIGMLIHILGSLFTVGFFWLIWPFFYNKNYINRLLEKGYIPFSNKDLSILKDSGIVVNKVYDSGNNSEKHGQNGSSEIVQQESDELGLNAALISSFDLTNQISLAWPVAPLTGSLMKSLTKSGEEKIACYFDYQNVQHRKISYTQWEIKCFDIIKKPILTEIPVIIRHENTLEPGETVKVVSSGTLPQGTRLFIPYLQAVLYTDQTVEEFPENKFLTDIKPRMRISEILNYSEIGLFQYQESKGLEIFPQFAYEKSNEGIWTCAYCGTRNSPDASECKLCNTSLSQGEHCTKDGLAQLFLEYQAQQEQIAEEQLKQEQEETIFKAEQEEKDRLERVEKRRIKQIRYRRFAKRFAVVAIIVLALITIAGMSWNFIFKPAEEYKKANMLFAQGQYFEAFSAYKVLGNFRNARVQSLEAYAEYLETESAEGFRVEGYDWLLENSYPKEVVFESFPKVLDATIDLDARLKGWIWLESKGYENAKERMYTLASDMVSNGRFLDAHGIYSLLGEFKDAQKNALALLRKVTFDGNGSDLAVQMTDVVLGTLVSAPTVPLLEGYEFGGWWKDSMMTVPWDFQSDRITSDLTLFAKWIKAYRVGEVGPAGGYIFYDKGKFSDGWRYLEAASESYDFKNRVWGGHGTTVEGIGTAIGTGASNTEKIVARFGIVEPFSKQRDYAAKICADLVVVKDGINYDDWFLPSKDELDLMYQNLKIHKLGAFSDDSYWSSSENASYFACYQAFSNGGQDNTARYNEIKVRPVRAF